MRTLALRTVVSFLLAFPLISLLPVSASGQSVWDGVPDEIRSRNVFKRFEWFYRQRAFPLDTIPYAVYASEFVKETAKRPPDLSGSLNWSQIGPRAIISTWPPLWGELSGRVRTIAVHPTNPDIVYMGAASGGLWKTTNGGLSWSSVSEEFLSSAFGAVAIDPSNPNIVYAGGGETVQFSNPWLYTGSGLHKSTDGGTTWTRLTNSLGERTHFGALAVSPHNPAVVFAALGSGNTFLGNLFNEGVWRSTDGGLTFGRTLNVEDAFDVLPHPTDPTIVYAASGGGTANAGFYVSTDNGATWTLSNAGLPGSVQIGRMQITLCRDNPSIMYAVIYGASTTRAYKSINGGASWGQISPGVQLGGTYNAQTWVDQGWYDLAIAVQPNNSNHVYIGNVEFHKTTNGQDFAPVRSPQGPYGGTRAWDSPMHTDYHKIVFAPSNPNIIYVGCDGGMYRSSDGGLTWHSRNSTLSSIQYYRMASHPSNPDIVIGGAQDNGNYRTADRGLTPWSIVTTGDGMECFFDHTDPNNVYMSTQNGNLLKSTSGGLYGTFSGVRPQWDATPYWITPFFMHPTNNQIIYAASRRFWRSTSGGANWESISGTISSDVINTVSQSPIDPNMLILGAGGSSNQSPQVFVSSNGGYDWSDVTTRIPGPARYISRVVAHQRDASGVFVVRSGFGSGKVYLSRDFGLTWTNITGDLPDIPHNDLFVDPMRPYHYYVANDFGVYLTTNGGTNWIRQGEGMPFVPVLDFDYFNYGGTRLLRVGTHGRSAFEALLTLDSVATIFVSPSSKDFGKLEANVERDTVNVVISNFGSSALTLFSVTRTRSEYSFLNLPSLPVSIPGFGSLNFGVVFTPSTHGTIIDSVVIASSDLARPTSIIPLTGKGILIGRAQPGVMYAASSATPSGMLYSINTVTGEATGIGSLGISELHGLAIRPGNKELYGAVTNPLETRMYRVSAGYGDALPLVTIPLANMRAIAFSVADTLYGATTTGNLYRINPQTGDTVYIGNASGIFYSGLSFSPTSGRLWASVRPPISNRDRIYTVNTSTGAVTLVGATGDNTITPYIAFSPLGTLFGLKGSATQINTLIGIDTLTALGTLIGSSGVSGLQAITMRTDSIVVAVGEQKAEVPATFFLGQNYPNPFNPTTTIRFGLPKPSHVSVKLYDLLGQEVASLVNGELDSGVHHLHFNAGGLASGMYFYRMQAGGFTEMKKLLLVR